MSKRPIGRPKTRWEDDVFRDIKSLNVACMAEETGVHIVLVGKPEGKSPLVRPRRRWEDNIKMDLQEVEYGVMNWIELAEDRNGWGALVSTVKNFRVP
jgi:hypothetical protein